MSAIVADWSTFEPGQQHFGFEQFIGEKLKTGWDAIAREKLPPNMLEAIDALFEPPVNSAVVGKSISSARNGWAHHLWWEFFSTFHASKRRRKQRANQRMMERAIRKQGVAWLASADSRDLDI